jgi:hypothetical protein
MRKMRSKGIMEEMVWIIVIIMATLIMTLFLYNQRFSGIEVRKHVEERIMNEEGISLLFSLSANKPPYIEKYYSQMLIDAVLEGNFWKNYTGFGRGNVDRGNMSKVFYGNGIGRVNLTEITPMLIKKFTDKKWKLTVVTPDATYFYGESEIKDVLYSYEILVPVPEERLGRIVFEIS